MTAKKEIKLIRSINNLNPQAPPDRHDTPAGLCTDGGVCQGGRFINRNFFYDVTAPDESKKIFKNCFGHQLPCGKMP